ncbi:MAG: hypothetical protein IT467_06080 [Dokdonella sp.]|uniref:hypothetical protein n=1 Tax=Dokdonella sp. TaxID=2291710 RepID=UPI0025C582AA|nr:hypothetical protein [Dokdonella sp.]MBZ0221963.1 hypothetical protein [Dokdonella sp.]MCC7255485.1 hypothetical protein [Dokdonella sp.]
MQWLGWLVALVVALVASWLVHAWRSSRARADALFYEKIDLENELDTLHAERVANPVLEAAPAPAPVVVAPPPVPAVDTAQLNQQLDELAAQLDEYRERNRAYDAAVQVCLQPVEMLIGADAQTQTAALGYIDAARKPLFAARQAVQKAALNRNAATLDALRASIAAAAPVATADAVDTVDVDSHEADSES